MFEGKPLVLVHHVGAKSGTARIAPLVPYRLIPVLELQRADR